MSNDQNMPEIDVDDMLDMSMDDIEDLPPGGIPCSGFYTFKVEFKQEKAKEKGKRDQLYMQLTVDAIGELAEGSDPSEAGVGQQFRQYYNLVDKEGKRSEKGLQYLKRDLEPFAAHFEQGTLKGAMQAANDCMITAILKRRKAKKEDQMDSFTLSDVTVL